MDQSEAPAYGESRRPTATLGSYRHRVTSRLYRELLTEGLRPVLGGTALGIAVAFAVARLFSALLVGVTATDAMTFVTVAVVLTGIGFLAIWLAAGRVARLNSLDALRTEQ